MKIIHIITGLNIGGAEKMLERLLLYNLDIDNITIISLSDIGKIGINLEKKGFKIYCLDVKKNITSLILAVIKMIRLIRNIKPNLIQTWLYHANLLGSIASLFSTRAPVIWNLRGCDIPQGALSQTFMIVKLLSLLSYLLPYKIICCGNSVKEAHITMGYSQKKMVIIENGYNFQHLKRNEDLRKKTRKDLHILDHEIIIGSVGRFDVLKDYESFVRAASLVDKKIENIRFMIIGRDININNSKLNFMINDNNMLDKIILIDEQDSLEAYYSSMDVFCLHSISEGFPNVLAEAMSYELPCVSTDAGDAKVMLMGGEFICNIKDFDSLANGLIKICSLTSKKRYEIGRKNAHIISENYNIDKIHSLYRETYEKTIS